MADESTDNEIQQLELENERLYAVLEAQALVSSTLSLQVVLDTLMTKAREVMQAEASSLMLLDEETQELFFHTLTGDKSDVLRSIRLKLGEGIAGWVAREGEPLLVEDCSKDPRFSSRADQISQFRTHSMMCVPLKYRRRVIGTVQVLNKEDGSFFNQKDLKIFHVLADQAAIAVENARLHEMATVDAMTGLYRKAYFLARAEEELRRARYDGSPLSLLMTDIDFFKKVNDRFGHQGGDTALVAVAGVLNDTVRRIGGELIAGRYGGEEFCVLMPDTDPDRALEYGEMIRRDVENNPIPIGAEEANITISVGVSSFPAHTEQIKDTADMIRLADEALYICKDRGRNCVSLYQAAEGGGG